VTVELEQVTRSRRVVRAANPDTAVTRTVFGVRVEHPAGAGPAALAYALVPGAGEARLRAYARGPLCVLANTPRLQAIKHTGLDLVAANVFADGWQHADRLAVHGPATTLMHRQPDGTVTLAVSDPTMHRDTVRILIRGEPLTPISADDQVRVDPVPGGTLITATTRRAHGRSLTATLRPRHR
jgi:hyaluronate lyase